MHYRITLAPVLASGAIESIRWLSKRVSAVPIVLYLMGVTFFAQFVFHLPLNKLSKPVYWSTESWMRHNRTMIAKIPKNARIAAQQNLAPHLSSRQFVYLAWPRVHESGVWWLDIDSNADLLLVDTRTSQWLTQTLESSDNFLEAIRNMEKSGVINEVDRAGDAVMYRVNR